MSRRVQLANAVFYKVREIRIKNDPDKGSGVYIELHSDGGEWLGSCSQITAFGPEDDPPDVYVDGVKIEPNPVAPELVHED